MFRFKNLLKMDERFYFQCVPPDSHGVNPSRLFSASRYRESEENVQSALNALMSIGTYADSSNEWVGDTQKCNYGFSNNTFADSSFCNMINDDNSVRAGQQPLASFASLNTLETETCRTANRKCEAPGCSKCAQGKTNFCISHGGGRRCTFPGCTKGARDRLYCAAHGGGRRCSAPDCRKAAVGGSSLCTAHGGGRKCQVDGCTKSAQSPTSFCVRHGGGRLCAVDGCHKVFCRILNLYLNFNLNFMRR